MVDRTKGVTLKIHLGEQAYQTLTNLAQNKRKNVSWLYRMLSIIINSFVIPIEMVEDFM